MTRKMQLVVIAVVILLVPAVSSACPVCYGSPSSPLTKGSDNAALFMIGIIGFVQTGLVAMFWAFWRRAKALRRRRDSFRVIEGGAAH